MRVGWGEAVEIQEKVRKPNGKSIKGRGRNAKQIRSGNLDGGKNVCPTKCVRT